MKVIPTVLFLVLVIAGDGMCENVETKVIDNPERSKRIVSSGESTHYIIGGEEAGKNEFPFAVYIRMDYLNESSSTLCGGSLIEMNLVLTAAHCLCNDRTLALESITAYAGFRFLDNSDNTGQNLTGNYDFVCHEEYSPNTTTFYNDIALLKFANNLHETPAVKPIQLPPPNFSSTGDGTVAGWGITDGGSPSKVLLKANVTTVKFEECNAKYDNLLNDTTQFCAKGSNGNEGVCPGDSGGPLLCHHGQTTELCGIISFGKQDCSQTSEPAVYTYVPYYLKWINDNKNKLNPVASTPTPSNAIWLRFDLLVVIMIIIFPKLFI